MTFEEWGQLGIAFAVFLGVVIPLVFSPRPRASRLARRASRIDGSLRRRAPRRDREAFGPEGSPATARAGVEDPAKSLGVKPASVLVSLNGKTVESLGEDGDMLSFISDEAFPKTCVFRRPPHPLAAFGAPGSPGSPGSSVATP